jgi:hypothetical protein
VGGLPDYDQNWLIPNLGLIDQTDFVTMLFDNPRFTESFLVGLSDEMGRELLWRGYPTDQRGTYFYRMWSETSDLTQQIARFPSGALGTHLSGGANPRVVMLVRGAVIKRHPDAIFVAVQRDSGSGLFSSPPASGKGSILFHAALGVDTILVGFDLVEADIKSGNWWFLLAEHPSAPRFGLDVGPHSLPLGPGASKAIDEVAWGDLPMKGAFLHASTPGAKVTTPGDGSLSPGVRKRPASPAFCFRIPRAPPSRRSRCWPEQNNDDHTQHCSAAERRRHRHQSAQAATRYGHGRAPAACDDQQPDCRRWRGAGHHRAQSAADRRPAGDRSRAGPAHRPR